ncbi:MULTISPECIES: ABC-F family ATP-binding cassette domain-containing protein [unclassified Granulicatella]|uniref:ABC-F family ATP-binding cassette domain-containing protein n=1 Tax=unclassified Granulicatella TaxID=2630493 RepID=UPI001073EE36|nr:MULTISPECIES: ABC-F family ATP-binding cassette domain-containing protein [unclassified Granulicatella]MBF0779646.1 ABC-F family ATP-binding cassette domain-containing protein [Granulicatella sp. 19428wC4_WM01]TFU96303.1 ABC transporter ATP-binding protein [Granulicatella sp. WM01]
MEDFKVIDLHKTYGIKTLLNGVSFTIRQGEHVGLIGQNGTGKSSLLSILSRQDSADSGIIETSSRYRIGYLKQDPVLNPEHTVFQAVYHEDTPLLQTITRYERALGDLEKDAHSLQFQKAYEEAEQMMTRLDAWQYDVKIKTILTKLGITHLSQKISELSGGQRKRIGLAQVLIQEPDLLLLDEPTNHLDYDSIEWLEQYLADYKGSLLLVTHDRYFLERVVSKIFELTQGRIDVYEGNYQTYLSQKAERIALQERFHEKQLKRYTSELEWMRKGAKARTTKQQARIGRFASLEEQVKQKQTTNTLELSLEGSRLGKKVLTFEQVDLVMHGHSILKQFDYIVQTHDCIGIVGNNGVGKSTLLNAIAGLLPFTSGIYSMGETVKLAYYKQLSDDLPNEKRVISYLQEVAEEVDLKGGERVGIAELLETFLFPRSTHGTLIKTLSGGEKRRLYLLRLLIEKPNVLLLDEPTNDLDIDTLSVLEDYLDNFSGATLIVSHDRYFLDRVTDKLIILDGQGHVDTYLGSMSDYLQSRQTTIESTTPIKEAERPRRRENKRKMTYHEQKEWESIEDDIMHLEQTINTLQTEMAQCGSDFETLQQLHLQLDALNDQLVEKMERWEYLSELT